VPCARGGFCAGEGQEDMTFTPCPAGSYSNRTGLSSVSQCTPCPVGSYCLEGFTGPRLCRSGVYGDTVNTTTADCAGVNHLTHTPDMHASSAHVSLTRLPPIT
jgi:hypothetical protein